MNNEAKELVLSIVKENASGIMAKDIEKQTGLKKEKINHFLFLQEKQHIVKYDRKMYKWSFVGTTVELDPVLRKFNNFENASHFTQNDFHSLADWKSGISPSKKEKKEKYTTKTGNTIYCDSKAEIKMLEYLEGNDLVLDCGGQALKIQFSTFFKTGNEYTPDIVALTKDGYIAIIEVKSVTAMDNHRSREKYEGLAKYCKQNGFIYCMIDPQNNFISFEELLRYPVIDKLRDAFYEKERRTGANALCLTQDDIDEWYRSFGGDYCKKQFCLMAHALIAQLGWYNTFANGFKVYRYPIKLDQDMNIAEICEATFSSL